MSATLDRDAARKVLEEFFGFWADHGPDIEDQALDALAGCVRPVPPQIIDRDDLIDHIRHTIWHESESAATAEEVADGIIARLVPDSRFDTIRALHEPEQHYTIDQKHRHIPTYKTCKNDKQRYPCATVRALDGDSETSS